jgi:16S rRNA (cytosine967-C5)-methyltransferase
VTPSATRRTDVSPARDCALTVLRRVFEQDAYADRAFAAEARQLAPRDRALAMAMAYGAVQRRRTLDHVAGRLARRPPERLDAPVIAALRLGLFQILYLNGIADHAAVHETVQLAKRSRPAAAGLVNAVLRRATTEGRELLAGLHDRDPDAAALLHSVPTWLARRWWDELGAQDARSLLASINQPAESALRVNTLVASVEEVTCRLDVPFTKAPGIPEGLVLGAPFDAEGSAAWSEGAIMPQSRASMLVSRVVAPAAGERVLDLCAAPGAKTTHLAALTGGEGEVVAVERHPGRADALRRTCRRMRADSVMVVTADAAALADERKFDRVLVDPPCSGLGTLQSRPDLRWRASADSIGELAEVQRRILGAAARVTRPGGTLVYSVCTISREEGQRQVQTFLQEHPEFDAVDLPGGPTQWAPAGVRGGLQLRPDRDGTDGFFISGLRRLRRRRYP